MHRQAAQAAWSACLAYLWRPIGGRGVAPDGLLAQHDVVAGFVCPEGACHAAKIAQHPLPVCIFQQVLCLQIPAPVYGVTDCWLRPASELQCETSASRAGTVLWPVHDTIRQVGSNMLTALSQPGLAEKRALKVGMTAEQISASETAVRPPTCERRVASGSAGGRWPCRPLGTWKRLRCLAAAPCEPAVGV